MNKRNILGLSLISIMLMTSSAQALLERSFSDLTSNYAAGNFIEVSKELSSSEEATQAQKQQALIMIDAAHSLDNNIDGLYREIIKLANLLPGQDISETVVVALKKYLRGDSDLVIAQKAAQYLLANQNTREEKEAMLSLLLTEIAPKNKTFYSDLATELAFLQIEKADIDVALQLFNAAYEKNPYNNLAFAKIKELSNEPLNDASYLFQYRFMLEQNPVDIESAVNFALYAYTLGVYDVSYNAWQYCYDLYEHLNPGQPIPPYIYIPFTSSAANSAGNASNCLKISAKLNKLGIFDLRLEAITAKAAKVMANEAMANKIIDDAINKALELNQSRDHKGATSQMISWFYCFVDKDPGKALAWANKAYSENPNDVEIQSLMGYSLILNDQYDIAPEYLKTEKNSQISLLARSMMLFNEYDDEKAIETLKQAIAIDAGSIETETIGALLEEKGSSYITMYDSMRLKNELRRRFGTKIISKFVPAEKFIQVKLKSDGNTFNYGQDIPLSLVLTNVSEQTILIGQDGLIKGNIVISAKISGDINASIPALLNFHIRPSNALKADKSVVVPLDIEKGPLKEILKSYPQANLNIEFKAHVDPIFSDNSRDLDDAVSIIKPTSLKLSRTAVQLSNRYVQQRLDAINKGKKGQIIQSIKLFSGLLTEQAAMANFEKPLYSFLYAESDLLRSSLTKALRDGDWTIQILTMKELSYLPNYKSFTGVLTELMQSQNWPVRLMAIRLLKQNNNPDFDKVLDWIAINDQQKFVREMAIAIGAKTVEK